MTVKKIKSIKEFTWVGLFGACFALVVSCDWQMISLSQFWSYSFKLLVACVVINMVLNRLTYCINGKKRNGAKKHYRA